MSRCVWLYLGWTPGRIANAFVGANGTLIQIKILICKSPIKKGSIAVRQIENIEVDKVQIANDKIKQLIVLL